MKLLGMSSSKIASVVFLLMTLLIALFLSSFEFLKTNNMAEVPVFKEGHESMADEESPVIEPPIAESTVVEPHVDEEKEEQNVEGFEIKPKYTSLTEAFGRPSGCASRVV